MRLVAQKHVAGCGVACVAVSLGKNYKQTLKLFTNGDKKARQGGFFCRDIVSALKKIKIDSRIAYIGKNAKSFEIGTIVFVRNSRWYPKGHYLLKVKDGWFDPWINYGETTARAGIRRTLPGIPKYAVIRIKEFQHRTRQPAN